MGIAVALALICKDSREVCERKKEHDGAIEYAVVGLRSKAVGRSFDSVERLLRGRRV